MTSALFVLDSAFIHSLPPRVWMVLYWCDTGVVPVWFPCGTRKLLWLRHFQSEFLRKSLELWHLSGFFWSGRGPGYSAAAFPALQSAFAEEPF